jgi:hypothetical protein
VFRSTALAVLFSLTVFTSAHGQDRPPFAFHQHATFASDQLPTIRLTGDDPDGDVLTIFTIEVEPAHLTLIPGSASATACFLGGRCSFLPESGFIGTDSLIFTVGSSHDGVFTTSEPATITIDMVDSLPGPVAFSQRIMAIHGTAVRINPTGNDPEGDFLTYAVTGGPANGQLDRVFGTVGDRDFPITYTPDADFFGRDSLLFMVSDGNSSSAPAAIIIDVVQERPWLAAAVLPGSRSVLAGTPATAFATILNAGPETATACTITSTTFIPADFFYQTTEPINNEPIGTPNTPVDIAPGTGQTFLVAFIPSSSFDEVVVRFQFDCTNTDPAPVIVGVNTLLLSASEVLIPDIVAASATINNDRIVIVPGETGSGVFAVATVNVGVAGAITVSADTGSVTLPVSVFVCETNPATSACLANPGPEVTTTIESNATPTFGVFVVGGGTVPFDPANNRIFVRFRDEFGQTRGSTSVAVRTQ